MNSPKQALLATVPLLLALLLGLGCSKDGGSGRANDSDDTSSTGTSGDLFSLGVQVTGLTGRLVLQNHQEDDLVIESNGAHDFATLLPGKSSYAISVKEQPTGAVCTVDDSLAFGTIEDADVAGIPINCVEAYSIGGTIRGLEAGATVVIGLGDFTGWQASVSLDANGSYTFDENMSASQDYGVYISAHPANQTCYVQNALGTIGSANVANADLFCWSGVDAYYADASTILKDLEAHANGDLYAVGTAEIVLSAENNEHWIVRKSTDGGDSWSVVDDYHDPIKEDLADTTFDDHFVATAVTSDGADIYVAGYAIYNSDSTGWSETRMVIRKSVDYGASWSVLSSPLTDTLPIDLIYVPTLGKLVVGANQGSNPSTWVLAEIDPSSGVLSLIDTINETTKLYAIAADTAGNIFAAGTVQPNMGPESNQLHWYVTRSSYSSGWTTTLVRDIYQDNWELLATDIVIDDGTVYVSGIHHDILNPTGDIAHWKLESSDNGGTDWSLVDSFQMGQPQPTITNYAAHLAIARTDGSIYTTGLAQRDEDYAGADFHLTRSNGSDSNFGLIDNTGQTLEMGMLPNALAVDPSGTVYIGGISTATGTWFVKRFSP